MLYPQTLVVQHMGNHSGYWALHIHIEWWDLRRPTTQSGSTRRSRRWALKTHIFLCSCHRKSWSGKRITSRVSLPKLLGLRERASMGTRHCYAWTDHANLEASQISKNPSPSVLRQKPPCILVRLISTSVCRSLTTTKITQSGSRVTEIFR